VFDSALIVLDALTIDTSPVATVIFPMEAKRREERRRVMMMRSLMSCKNCPF
jgi:hypothetical protein